MEISFGLQPRPGEPAPPEAMRAFFGGPLTASYVAEWHSGVIDELRKINPPWAGITVWGESDPKLDPLRAAIRDAQALITQVIVFVTRQVAARPFRQRARVANSVHLPTETRLRAAGGALDATVPNVVDRVVQEAVRRRLRERRSVPERRKGGRAHWRSWAARSDCGRPRGPGVLSGERSATCARLIGTF
jgi:hypothetical protein